MNSHQRRKFKRSKGVAMVRLCEEAGVEVPLKYRKWQRAPRRDELGGWYYGGTIAGRWSPKANRKKDEEQP